jgi:hypothetical protein
MSVVARAAPLLVLLAGACAEAEDRERAAPRDAGVDRVVAVPAVGPAAPGGGPAPDPQLDAGACAPVTEAPPVVDGNHVPEPTPIAYPSIPPSSGPHYPRWANFQEFDHPIADGYLVHALEHGAVVLFYRCDGDACGPLVSALRAVRDAVATDPKCDPSIRVRVIIAPRSDLDVPVAAAAWGHTYRAQCVDPVSLGRFIADHYARAPEDFCSPGAAAL